MCEAFLTTLEVIFAFILVLIIIACIDKGIAYLVDRFYKIEK